jgi:hypothetical protein
MSQEYLSALAVVLIGILKMFKIDVDNATITAFITVVLGAWIAIRRYQRGDIKLSGVRK